MPGFVIGTSLPIGVPGDIAYNCNPEIASRQLNPTDTLPIYFGDPVVAISNTTNGYYSSVAAYIAGGGTFTFNKFGGIALRNVKSFTQLFGAAGYPQSPTRASYNLGNMVDVMKRGLIIATCNVGTPTSQGPVYVRVALNGSVPNGVIGGFEAASDGGNTVQLTNCQFYSGLIDTDLVTVIEILTVNLA